MSDDQNTPTGATTPLPGVSSSQPHNSTPAAQNAAVAPFTGRYVPADHSAEHQLAREAWLIAGDLAANVARVSGNPAFDEPVDGWRVRILVADEHRGDKFFDCEADALAAAGKVVAAMLAREPGLATRPKARASTRRAAAIRRRAHARMTSSEQQQKASKK